MKLKPKSTWVLPSVALLLASWVLVSNLNRDNRHAAAERFKRALMSKRTDTLFEFVEKDERDALQMTFASFDLLMKEEFYREWDFSVGQWTEKVQPDQSGELVYLESISNPSSNMSLGTYVVGEPGNFRVPGFTYFVLHSTAMKRFGIDKSLQKSGGLARMSPFCKLLESDLDKLAKIGILAYYDPSSRSTMLLGEARQRWQEQIENWRKKNLVGSP